MKKIIYSVCFFLLFQFFYKTGTAQASAIGNIKARSSKKSIIKYGLASFYAKKFSGRKTSNGSRYNSVKFTAACNVLPLGTWVKVTNLKNKKTVIVFINDHLHYKNKRLIDLSKSAAEKLAFISRGITRVKVEVLKSFKNKIVNE